MNHKEEQHVADIISSMLTEIGELTDANRELEGKVIFLETEIALSKPVYSRRQLEASLSKTEAQLSEAIKNLTLILEHYVRLASSGDCGFWDPEEEDLIKECRIFIKKIMEA